MTIDQFITLIKSIDPKAMRYEAIGQKGDAYTVFAEYGIVPLYANGRPAGLVTRVQVDFFTRRENDPKAKAFFIAFATNDSVTCKYDIDFETESRYIHHIYDCEVIG